MLRLDVLRRELPLEDFWLAPQGISSFELHSAVDGTTARLRSRCSLYHDTRALYVLFQNEDDEVLASKLQHDDNLWEEDVVEAFLAPRTVRRYFELEVNPLGTTFDALVDSPDGRRDTMHVDRSWSCEGMWTAVRRKQLEGERFELATLLAIPFTALNEDPPSAGTTWRANFFRIDRSTKHDDAFLAWSPTGRNPADFHVPAAFGEIVFR